MSSTIKLLLLAAVPFLSTAAAQDISSGPINGNGISCIGNNACCEGTVLSGGRTDVADSVCCPEQSGGNIIGGQGTMCATGTAVPMTEGVTISAKGAAASTSMDSGSSSTSVDMSMMTSMAGGDSTSMDSSSTMASSTMASSSAMAASTSSGMGAAKTVGVMGPAALGMGAMAVGFGMF